MTHTKESLMKTCDKCNTNVW